MEKALERVGRLKDLERDPIKADKKDFVGIISTPRQEKYKN
jgi:hypothetical protein